MRNNRMLLLPTLTLALLAGCAGRGGEAPPETAGQVDLTRYQGTWYELARLPMFFQRRCVASEAHYRLTGPAEIAVLNRCRTLDGDWQEAHGTAWPQEEGRTDRLWVRFDNWVSRLLPRLTRGDYWVLHVDDDYRLALVGSPDRENLWLLAREPEVAAADRGRLLTIAKSRGYYLDALIWRGERP